MEGEYLPKISDQSATARVNITLRGEPAQILLELKRRGVVRSNTAAVVQGLFLLWDKITERDLARARVNAIREEG